MNKKIMNKKPIIKVRLNSFETNSSSMHTVILVDNEGYTDPTTAINEYLDSMNSERVYDENGAVYLPIPRDDYGDPYDFGRGFSININWKEKFAYIIAILGAYEISKTGLLQLISKRSGISIAGLCINLSKYAVNNVFRTEGTLTLKAVDSDVLYGETGSVDHQSMDNISNCLAAMAACDKYKDMTDAEKLYEIIFSNEFAIVEDSDETDSLREYITSNILDCAKIKYILHESYDSNYINKKCMFKPLEEWYDNEYDD